MKRNPVSSTCKTCYVILAFVLLAMIVILATNTFSVVVGMIVGVTLGAMIASSCISVFKYLNGSSLA